MGAPAGFAWLPRSGQAAGPHTSATHAAWCLLLRSGRQLPAHLVRVTVVLLMSYCFFHLAAKGHWSDPGGGEGVRRPETSSKRAHPTKPAAGVGLREVQPIAVPFVRGLYSRPGLPAVLHGRLLGCGPLDLRAGGGPHRAGRAVPVRWGCQRQRPQRSSSIRGRCLPAGDCAGPAARSKRCPQSQDCQTAAVHQGEFLSDGGSW